MEDSKVIHKYPLENSLGIVAFARLPEDAEIISVAGQRGKVMVYAIVDPNERSTVDHTFYVMPTGYPFRCLSSQDFLGTVSLYDGDLVFHIFHKKEAGGE